MFLALTLRLSFTLWRATRIQPLWLPAVFLAPSHESPTMTPSLPTYGFLHYFLALATKISWFFPLGPPFLIQDSHLCLVLSLGLPPYRIEETTYRVPLDCLLTLGIPPLHPARSPIFPHSVLLGIPKYFLYSLTSSPFSSTGIHPFPMILSHWLKYFTFFPTWDPTVHLVLSHWFSHFHKEVDPPFSLPVVSPFSHLQWNGNPTIHPILSPHTRAPDFITLGFSLVSCLSVLRGIHYFPFRGPHNFLIPHISHLALITLWCCLVHCLLTLKYPLYSPTRVPTISLISLQRVTTFLMMIPPCFIF